jgi:hypothetical protein
MWVNFSFDRFLAMAKAAVLFESAIERCNCRAFVSVSGALLMKLQIYQINFGFRLDNCLAD